MLLPVCVSVSMDRVDLLTKKITLGLRGKMRNTFLARAEGPRRVLSANLLLYIPQRVLSAVCKVHSWIEINLERKHWR